MKISVIIITRNRCEDVRNTLIGFNRQTYQDKEIIVIDNASNDGTRAMFAEEFPEIKYLWLPDNFDIRSINIGIEMSDGDIIWRTDSDSYPESEFAFEKVVEIFRSRPEVHVICSEDIEVLNNSTVWDWYPFPVDKKNIPADGYPANTFAGTGAAIRREVYDKVGGFWGFGFEEIEFCTRAILAGFNVRYFPQIRTLHFSSPRDRDNSNRWVMISTQYIRYIWKYFPLKTALGRTVVFYINQILLSFFSKVKMSARIEGALTMLSVIFHTVRNERRAVPKEKIKDITLGVSLYKNIFMSMTYAMNRKIKKWLKD
ncbi:MAG: glycosyltransferase [Candidatus Kapabacteria bacterium]|nr:glycosyltransferase [Candidatus Kapabacteria bacterium]